MTGENRQEVIFPPALGVVEGVSLHLIDVVVRYWELLRASAVRLLEPAHEALKSALPSNLFQEDRLFILIKH